MTLQVQDYLRSFPDPETAIKSLAETYGIKVVSDNERCLLNYGPTTPKSKPGTECRGLILSLPRFDVLSFSFERFFNHQEPQASDIDWATAAVYEKMDGTLITFYHDGEDWNFHTRGTLDAEGPTPSSTGTFRDRVIAVIRKYGYPSLYRLLEGVPRHHCVACEYVGPHNRIVTSYSSEELYLLATTDRTTCKTVQNDPRLADRLLRPKTYHLSGGLNQAIESLENLHELDEGYVVLDALGNRVKIKSPRYVAIHNAVKAGNAPSQKNFARLALAGDTDEIKGHFPELRPRIEAYEELADHISMTAEELLESLPNGASAKEFAFAVKSHAISGWLFSRRSGKTKESAREWMGKNTKPEMLVDYIDSTPAQPTPAALPPTGSKTQ